MTENAGIDEIVKSLAAMTASLGNEYLCATFGQGLPLAATPFNWIIVVAEEGDVEHCYVAPFVQSWWIVVEGTPQKVNCPIAGERECPEPFLDRPLLRIYVEGSNFALAETYGPCLHCRRHGTIRDLLSGCQIWEFDVCWKSDASKYL
jgi:hypothetical protein